MVFLSNLIDKAFILFMVTFILQFLATVHIIYFCHPKIEKVAFALCEYCVKAVAVGVATTLYYFEFNTNIPISDPTPAGNIYQIYSFNGRGFGFDC